MPNNRLGSQPQSTPTPRDFDPGTEEDFSITRIVDGHAVFSEPEDRGNGDTQWTRANRHNPSESEDQDII